MSELVIDNRLSNLFPEILKLKNEIVKSEYKKKNSFDELEMSERHSEKQKGNINAFTRRKTLF